MPDPEPTPEPEIEYGVILSPLERFRTMLADCIHVARWMGFDSNNVSDLVLDRIYLDGISSGQRNIETLTADEHKTLRPYIAVYPSAEAGYEFTKARAPNCWDYSGVIIAAFSRSYDPKTTVADTFRNAALAMERIVSCDDPEAPGLIQMAMMAGYLNLNRISVFFEGRTPQEEIVNYGDAYDVALVVEYS
jgi:hypothetical protein